MTNTWKTGVVTIRVTNSTFTGLGTLVKVVDEDVVVEAEDGNHRLCPPIHAVPRPTETQAHWMPSLAR
jgi:hypothetical protein